MSGRVERRLAAVLAADVAGYTRLMGADEVGTLEALKAHRREVIDPAIAGHKGRIVKTTGDGMLVEFASAVDAVNCAMTVQQKMSDRVGTRTPQISFRIGINIGDIIIDGDDIFGDGVNVAARVENECEPGGVCLSGSAYEQVRGKTSFTFDDLGERSLKNIDRAVRLYAVRSQSAPGASVAPKAQPTKPLALPDRPSIAVLPFQNMGGDVEQEYFADGMVEDIITALSRFKSLFVIARNSSFVYKGKAVDVRQVGKELGVRYVIEGSIRKVASRVRVTAQLIEAHSGAHIWADKIDAVFDDVFELQDDITVRVVGAIAPSILEAEISRALVKPTESQTAYDLYLKALSVHYAQSRESIATAISLLERAIQVDPNYSWAKAFAAYLYCLRVDQRGGSVDDIKKGAMLAREALEASRDEPNTIGFAAHAYTYLTNDSDVGLTAMDRALLMNPNSFDLLTRAGWMRIWIGDSELAINHFSRSLRLNPLDPQRGYSNGGIAFAYLIKEDFGQALEYARRAAQEMPMWTAGWFCMVTAAANLGKRDEMEIGKRRILEIAPNYSIAMRRKAHNPVVDKKLLQLIDAAMQAAGIPEQ